MLNRKNNEEYYIDNNKAICINAAYVLLANNINLPIHTYQVYYIKYYLLLS